MIECLSNESLINPQIDFLLFLQNIRVQHFEMFDKLFLSLTTLGEIWVPTLLCAIIYWCIDSKAGLYMFSVFGIDFIFTQIFKSAACVYRPWIFNNNVKPVKEAIPFALGYSFPSGHSATSTATYGGLAFLLRNKKLFCILLILLVLLIGFSRMWVGVHTPQDVIAGFTLGLIFIFTVNFLIRWFEKDKNRYLYFMVFFNIFALAALIYIRYFNNYPIDYVNGELLVNPARSIHTTTVCFGYNLGLLNGLFLCRRFFPFDAKLGTLKAKIIRGIIGTIGIYIFLNLGMEYCFSEISSLKLAFIYPFIGGFATTAVYPFIFTKVEKYFN